jgi:hypothetical protein
MFRSFDSTSRVGTRRDNESSSCSSGAARCLRSWVYQATSPFPNCRQTFPSPSGRAEGLWSPSREHRSPIIGEPDRQFVCRFLESQSFLSRNAQPCSVAKARLRYRTGHRVTFDGSPTEGNGSVEDSARHRDADAPSSVVRFRGLSSGDRSMSKDRMRRTAAKAVVDGMIHVELGSAEGAEHEALQRLIRHLRRVSSLLRPQRYERRHETVGQWRIVVSLVSLARHNCDWLWPVDGWIPGDLPPIPAFTSLAHHLFADYTVPKFITSVWFAGWTGGSRQPQEWFKLMGRGRNIRSADLPIPLTRSMAHHFCLAPDHFSVNHALRWGQIRGMGGNEGLARALITTRLGQDFDHDDFWKTVIQFFVNKPNLDLTHVGPIVEFLHHEKYEVRQGVLESGELGTLRPPRPDLSLKGRSVSSLLRDVREWQRRLGTDSRQPLLWWAPSPIGGFRHVDDDTDPHNAALDDPRTSLQYPIE